MTIGELSVILTGYQITPGSNTLVNADHSHIDDDNANVKVPIENAIEQLVPLPQLRVSVAGPMIQNTGSSILVPINITSTDASAVAVRIKTATLNTTQALDLGQWSSPQHIFVGQPGFGQITFPAGVAGHKAWLTLTGVYQQGKPFSFSMQVNIP